MATVILMLFSNKQRKDGKYPVGIRVGKDRKYSKEFVCYIQESHWNDVAKQVRSYDSHSPHYNAELRKRLREVEELISVYEQRGWPFTAQEILAVDYAEFIEKEKKAKLAAKPVVPDGFIAYIKAVIIPFWEKKNNLGNANKYKLEADVFADFLDLQTPKRTDIPMSKFTPELVGRYFAYLRTKKSPCRKDSTLRRRLSQINAVLRFAHEKGVLAKVPEIEVELNVQKSSKPKLTADQLTLLENYRYNEKLVEHMVENRMTRLDKLQSGEQTNILAVHTFLLQYYLFGARVGDMFLLKNENIIVKGGKPVRVEYYQQKGRKRAGKKLMSINVTPKVEALLRQYWKPHQPADFVLPWLADRYEWYSTLTDLENEQRLKEAIGQATSTNNMALKRVCKRLKIPLVTSHSARHTFAQRAKKKGKSIEFIKEAFGHSSYSITSGYMDDLDMDELNENLADVYD